ncbi:hypothetical protein BLA29_000703 [Euroglyphus maynei]|uniref:Uncharacterized protein n=1 Tax=Euroglyphus maynei TaxID=6958 RepID=A0A1Y3B5L8_EURMA|nr:hypothetical protein BLA29_000703 [Euroglyphus maynei]
MKSIIAIISFALLINVIIADDDSNQREQLLKKGEEIGKQAEDALKLLKSQNRNREVRRLEKDIPLLKELMQDYRDKQTDDEKMEILEKELTLLIKKMSLEIQMANSNDPDLHTTLVNRAKDMVQRGENTVKFLKSKNRQEDAKTIQQDVDDLTKIIDKVEQEDDMLKLNGLELQMIELENKLGKDIFDVTFPH